MSFYKSNAYFCDFIHLTIFQQNCAHFSHCSLPSILTHFFINFIHAYNTPDAVRNSSSKRHLLLLLVVRSLLLLCISFIIHKIFENALKLKNILVTKIASALTLISLLLLLLLSLLLLYIKSEREKELQLNWNSRRRRGRICCCGWGVLLLLLGWR